MSIMMYDFEFDILWKSIFNLKKNNDFINSYRIFLPFSMDNGKW